MLEIYRINSLVVLLPMVKEPVGAIWPEWRGLLIPDLISGRGEKKIPISKYLGMYFLLCRPNSTQVRVHELSQ